MMGGAGGDRAKIALGLGEGWLVDYAAWGVLHRNRDTQADQ